MWVIEIPEKTRRSMASSGTIRKCENPVTRPWIEPGSPWREARGLTARPPRPHNPGSDTVNSYRNLVVVADPLQKLGKESPPAGPCHWNGSLITWLVSAMFSSRRLLNIRPRVRVVIGGEQFSWGARIKFKIHAVVLLPYTMSGGMFQFNSRSGEAEDKILVHTRTLVALQLRREIAVADEQLQAELASADLRKAFQHAFRCNRRTLPPGRKGRTSSRSKQEKNILSTYIIIPLARCRHSGVPYRKKRATSLMSDRFAITTYQKQLAHLESLLWITTPLLALRNRARCFDLCCHSGIKGVKFACSATPVRSLACGRYRWSAGFLGDLTFLPPLHSCTAPYSSRFTLIGSQASDVKSRRNIFAHSSPTRSFLKCGGGMRYYRLPRAPGERLSIPVSLAPTPILARSALLPAHLNISRPHFLYEKKKKKFGEQTEKLLIARFVCVVGLERYRTELNRSLLGASFPPRRRRAVDNTDAKQAQLQVHAPAKCRYAVRQSLVTYSPVRSPKPRPTNQRLSTSTAPFRLCVYVVQREIREQEATKGTSPSIPSVAWECSWIVAVSTSIP
ncbi:hypothetical protein PR048_014280 [Dryococelus australis]|uniref:Uncharacterized protein n=1 Tax=Dryococelus australis TaxID=614101 RepID=A0ABQ9HDW7_9NEOP|nr:hypothetical protein PR048_014280 [Dryococelus australis]